MPDDIDEKGEGGKLLPSQVNGAGDDEQTDSVKTREDLLREMRELRDENARLRASIKKQESSDRTGFRQSRIRLAAAFPPSLNMQSSFDLTLEFPTGTKRLITALISLTIYNILYFVPGFYERIIAFFILLILAKLAGLPFAPMYIPPERRMQMLVIALTFAPLQMIECLLAYVFIIWYFRDNWFVLTIMLGYGAWIYIDKSPSRGGYKRAEVVMLCNSIPCCMDPTGIISVGAQANFGTDSTGFDVKFPGIDLTLMTLNLTFKIPFFRELVLAHGLASCGRKSINHHLESKEGGNAVMLGSGWRALSLPGTTHLF
eukprot:jgi/Bigna1/140606/aug1.57_g15314